MEGFEPKAESLDIYAGGAINVRATVRKASVLNLVAPPKLTLPEWAERFAYLSPETSSTHGKFHAFPYQVGIMEAVTDPAVKTITVVKSARVGYTKILDHVAAYFIHQDPSPVLMVQPRVEDAEDYSRTEIAPMLRDTPVLAAIVGGMTTRDPNQRILKRVFPNGSSLSFVGANSPGGFRRITARVVCFDEVDGYPAQGAGKEGDQIALGKKRTESFWNRKIILGSTPTLKEESRILPSWEDSDQRRYYVPCPHCKTMQTLKWSNIRWVDDDPNTAHYLCEASGCIIEEADKPWMIDKGEWRAAKPFNGHAGFHIWAGYSLFPNAAWRYLVEEFLIAKHDPVKLRTFVNLVLGEAWEDASERVEAAGLRSHVEGYGPDDLPNRVNYATLGGDVQADRIEVFVIGWGAGDESWGILYEVVYGDPARAETWAKVDEIRRRKFWTVDGRLVRIRAACFDTGGHHAAHVINYCRARFREGVYPIKGASGARPIWPKRASKSTNTKENIWIVGVDTAKDAIYGRFKIVLPEGSHDPMPGYVHLPPDFDDDWFEQVTSESVVTRYKEGRPYRVWVLPNGKRNEALDTFVYALAARMSLDASKTQPSVVKIDRTAEPQSAAEGVPAVPAPVIVAQQVRGRRVRSRGIR
jgi:phage terminase large subunit GpA-like protein